MKSNKIDKILTWAFGALTIVTVVIFVAGLVLHQLDVWDVIYLVVVVLNDIGLTINSTQEGWKK
ncbi:hypothetical protein [Latilactobacillus fragifolii]|uniref:hypothetical protein n=1 Tax=Latilactobacillus fragifolii TaxID=2814244 RepID=UPI001ABB0EA8|nr:hypothetical protein [Latilactobacillus fragifolii]